MVVLVSGDLIIGLWTDTNITHFRFAISIHLFELWVLSDSLKKNRAQF